MLKGRVARKFEISDGRRQCISNGLISTIRGTVVAIEVLYLHRKVTRADALTSPAHPEECVLEWKPHANVDRSRSRSGKGDQTKVEIILSYAPWKKMENETRERAREKEGGEKRGWIKMNMSVSSVEFIRELMKEREVKR